MRGSFKDLKVGDIVELSSLFKWPSECPAVVTVTGISPGLKNKVGVPSSDPEAFLVDTGYFAYWKDVINVWPRNNTNDTIKFSYKTKNKSVVTRETVCE